MTGRGAILGLAALSFVGMLASEWLRWGPLADGSFIIGCVLAGRYTKSSDLLPVVVSPPVIFLGAVICAKALTSSGAVSALEGTLVTLGNTALWLVAGTVLTIGIALFRGLPGNIRDLRQALRADPERSSGPTASATRR